MREGDEIVIDLLQSPQAAGGALRLIAPMAATVLLAAAFDVTLSLTGLDDALQRTEVGQALMAVLFTAIVLAGVTVTLLQARRRGRPVLALRIGAAGVALARPDGAEIARAPWSHVGIAVSNHRVLGRAIGGIYPALDLRVGAAAPLSFSVWDASQAWPASAPLRPSAPLYIVGAPQWSQLVAALRAARRL